MPAVSPLTSGVSIGPYRVVRPIWSGAIGEIYEVAAGQVAERGLLKIIPGQVDEVARYAARAGKLRGIHHPNLVRVVDAGRIPTAPGPNFAALPGGFSFVAPSSSAAADAAIPAPLTKPRRLSFV